MVNIFSRIFANLQSLTVWRTDKFAVFWIDVFAYMMSSYRSAFHSLIVRVSGSTITPTFTLRRGSFQ